MELKDMILSTLAELDNEVKTPPEPPKKEEISTPKEPALEPQKEETADDTRFLRNVRERILVLFEGFQAPNNKNIEAKVDLTLNFLEYLLASIEEELEKAEKSRGK
ncbi:hypothetical protein JWV37_08350 [Sulfurospirillum sp. T05]|uniref:Campylobacter invasion antigen D C-terminal domain-containing protein n=1 Tax=Sulfurospirillum tamanense TaxID=2813362 RepID=A0ABS2WT69_9BACT|nr:hypothetical protein [Sulfurospirillum tamanensis]MBN2964790.1 hypothetical protein [Sulfurospirillum tamanensis]